MERFVQYLPPANFFGCLFLSQSSWCYRITGMTEFLTMHPAKAEFKRLIELMGWSQTEAGRRLRKTPSAINHLVNPGHRNKPTATMMELLKVIIAKERPGIIDGQTIELKDAGTGAKFDAAQFSLREREIIEGLKKLSVKDQEVVYSVVKALLRVAGWKGGKTKR